METNFIGYNNHQDNTIIVKDEVDGNDGMLITGDLNEEIGQSSEDISGHIVVSNTERPYQTPTSSDLYKAAIAAKAINSPKPLRALRPRPDIFLLCNEEINQKAKIFYCAAEKCKNHSEMNNMTLFPFPQDDFMYRNWTSALGIRNNNLRFEIEGKCYGVCHMHFKKSSIRKNIAYKLKDEWQTPVIKKCDYNEFITQDQWTQTPVADVVALRQEIETLRVNAQVYNKLLKEKVDQNKNLSENLKVAESTITLLKKRLIKNARSSIAINLTENEIQINTDKETLDLLRNPVRKIQPKIPLKKKHPNEIHKSSGLKIWEKVKLSKPILEAESLDSDCSDIMIIEKTSAHDKSNQYSVIDVPSSPEDTRPQYTRPCPKSKKMKILASKDPISVLPPDKSIYSSTWKLVKKTENEAVQKDTEMSNVSLSCETPTIAEENAPSI